MPGFVFLAVFLGNAAFWHSPALGLVSALFALVFFGAQAGRFFSPDDTPEVRWWLGAWMLLSAVSLLGTAAYYAHSYPAWVAWALGLLLAPAAYVLQKKSRPDAARHDLWHEAPHRLPPWVLAGASAALLALAFTFRALVGSATTLAVASPWSVVPDAAFAGMALAAAALSALWSRGRERMLSTLLACAALFAFLSVNWAVFPIGAGFDPFIHQATERRIADTGTITPKPLYYVGQYALVLFLHHGFAIPVETADRYLLPLLTALLLPFSWLSATLHASKKDPRFAPTSLFLLFLLPLGGFATTTPQGLANLWILLLVLAAVPFLSGNERPHPGLLVLPTLATLAIHPLAGIPALLWCAYLLTDKTLAPKRFETVARALRIATVAGGSLLLPLAFVFFAWKGGTSAFDTAGAWERVRALFPAPPTVGAPYRTWLDFAVYAGYLAGAAFLALAAWGWPKAPVRLRAACVTFFLILLGNYVLLGTVFDFSFLIEYERLNYAARLPPLMLFALAPLAVHGLLRKREALSKAPRPVRWFAALAGAALIPALWYAAYPRDDAYQKGHGYNVSAADVDAVKEIESRALESGEFRPYVGLANQSVSAAAMNAIGFRYYGDQFFYPIPTGGDLYALFLKMNANPSRETARAALDLVRERCKATLECEYGKIQDVYYAVDAYWWDSKNIIAKAKTNADDWFALQNGAVHVFKYRFE